MAVERPGCTTIPGPPSPLSISLFGVQIKSMPISGQLVASELSYVQSVMAQIAPLLAAARPVFVLIDTVNALLDTVQAIPGLIVGDLPPFTDALSRVVDGVSALAGMTPQVAIPALVRDTVAFLVAFLQVMESQLDVIIAAEAEAAALAALAATAPDAYKVDMQAQAACAEDQATALLEHAVAAVGPVQSLLMIIDLLGSLVQGIPGMPEIGDLTGTAEEVKATMAALRQALGALPI